MSTDHTMQHSSNFHSSTPTQLTCPLITPCNTIDMSTDHTMQHSSNFHSSTPTQLTWPLVHTLGAAAMHTASAFLYTLSSHSFVCSNACALHASQVGIPGAGKSTGSAVLSSLLDESVVVIPVDGFHHYMAELRSRPDADAAVYRRGACVVQFSSLVLSLD
jgi:pantothenate kinase